MILNSPMGHYGLHGIDNNKEQQESSEIKLKLLIRLLRVGSLLAEVDTMVTCVHDLIVAIVPGGVVVVVVGDHTLPEV